MTRDQTLAWIARRGTLSYTGRQLLDYVRQTVYVPLVVAYGMGVDSTAMLVEMHNRGIRPDAIIFGDTGSEKPETYAYMEIIQAWLQQAGFPPVVTVRRQQGRTKYTTLHGECLTNGTLPAISVGMKSCSIKWKIEPFNKYMSGWGPAVRAWEQGGKIVKAIGFDAGPSDGRRILDADGNPRLEDDLSIYWYPLIEWGMDRDGCKDVIRSAGLPVPVKSACFMCGSMREHEIDDLGVNHPKLLKIALRIESNARPRLTRFPKFGLNRRFSWGQYLVLKKRQTSFLDLLVEPEQGRTTLPLAMLSHSDSSFVCPGG